MQAKDVDGKTPLDLTPSRRMGDMRLLFSKEEARRQSKQRRAEKDEAKVVDAMDYNPDEAIDEDDMIGGKTLRKGLVCLILPILILLLVNGWCFALKFMTGTLLFYTAMLAYFVTEIAVRPPWYHQSLSNRDNLRMKGCPLYWQGWITDPETDLGLEYEDVHFRSTDGYTLRGWHIFPPLASGDSKARKEDKENVAGREDSVGREIYKSPDFMKEADKEAQGRHEKSPVRKDRNTEESRHATSTPMSRTTSFAEKVGTNDRKIKSGREMNFQQATSPRERLIVPEVYSQREEIDGEKYEDCSIGRTTSFTANRPFPHPPSGHSARQDIEKRDIGVVLVHGGGRDRRAWLRHSYFLHQAGYGCLLFDFREHGLSDGKMRGLWFGMRERYDVIAAVDYMRRELHYKHVCVMGTSVGGSSVLMAAAIDKSIDAVISENPFTTCASLLDYQLITYMGNYAEYQVLSGYLFKLFRQLCRLVLNCRIGNFPSKHCQSLHCIDSLSPRPVMLLHGMEDSVVPYKHSQILYERAKAPKELYLFEKAYHCGLYNTDPEEYERRVLDFLARLKDNFKEGDTSKEMKKMQ